MDSILQILVSGTTLGAIYAISAIGLALLWGVMGMLNLAHGAFMAIGAYAAVYAVAALGLPWLFGLPIAFIVGLVVGWTLYQSTVRWIIGSVNYETNIVVATVGLAILIKSLLIIVFTANPARQPFSIDGGIYLRRVFLPYQTVLIIGITLALVAIVAIILNGTMMGRAIRATAQNPRAAALMGIPAKRIYLQVLMIACALATSSGVLVSSVVNVSPSTGEVEILKIFIICVVAGLGYIPGTILVAFAMAFLEVTVQYVFAAKWGYPIMIFLAILILIYKPSGVFGAAKVTRL